MVTIWSADQPHNETGTRTEHLGIGGPTAGFSGLHQQRMLRLERDVVYNLPLFLAAGLGVDAMFLDDE